MLGAGLELPNIPCVLHVAVEFLLEQRVSKLQAAQSMPSGPGAEDETRGRQASKSSRVGHETSTSTRGKT